MSIPCRIKGATAHPLKASDKNPTSYAGFCLLFLLVLTVSPLLSQQTDPTHSEHSAPRISNIIVIGNERTSEHTIISQLTFSVKEEIDYIKIAQSRKNLLGLEIFEHVDIIDKPLEDNKVEIIVYVDENLPFGVFPLVVNSQIDGWSYGGGFKFKNVSGAADRIGIYGVFGGIQNIHASYYIPLSQKKGTGLRIEAFYLERDNIPEDYHQTEYMANFQFERQFTPSLWWQLKLGHRWEYADTAGITLSGDRFDSIPFITLNGLIDTRDLYSNPSRGWRINNIVGQFGLPGSALDYRLFQMLVVRYIQIPWGRTLALGSQVTLKGGKIPPCDKLYLGGTETIRGMSPNSESGHNLMLGMAEYRIDFIKSRNVGEDFDLGLGGTLFWDGGIIWKEPLSKSPRSQHSFGFGLRILIPVIEVIRIDHGWASNGDARVAVAALAKF